MLKPPPIMKPTTPEEKSKILETIPEDKALIITQEEIKENLEKYSFGACEFDDENVKDLDARITVLNIVHEERDSLEWDSNLESIVEKKLDTDWTQKIKKALGGEITFSSLLPHDKKDEEAKSFYFETGIFSHFLQPAYRVIDIFYCFNDKLEKPKKSEDFQVVEVFQKVANQLLRLKSGFSNNKSAEQYVEESSENEATELKRSTSFFEKLIKLNDENNSQTLRASLNFSYLTSASAPAPTPTPTNAPVPVPVSVPAPAPVNKTEEPKKEEAIFTGITALFCDCLGDRGKSGRKL